MAKDTDQLVGSRISERRQQLGLSISKVCLASSISPPIFKLIEKGEQRLSPEELSRIAAAVGATIFELLKPEA